MDEYTQKRTVRGLGFSRRGSNLASRDSNRDDRSIQYCNRLGCSTSVNYMKGANVDNAEKLSCSRASFRSTSGKALAGSSSRSFSPSVVFRKSHTELKNKTLRQNASIAGGSNSSGTSTSNSRQKTQDLECSNAQQQAEELELSSKEEETEDAASTLIVATFDTLLRESEDRDEDRDVHQHCTTYRTGTLPIVDAISTSRSHRQNNRRLGHANQDISSFSAHRITASRATTQTVKPVSEGRASGSQRHALRNFSCTSISDVLPTGCSSADVGHKRAGPFRKRFPDGESSTRGKGIVGSSNGGLLGSPKSGSLGPSLSSPERMVPQQGSRKGRSWTANRDGVVSVRTRRGPAGDTRAGSAVRGDVSSPSLEPIVVSQMPQPQLHIHEDVPDSLSRSFAVECPPPLHDSFGRAGSGSRSARNRLPHSEGSNGQIHQDPVGDRTRYQHVNMEGLAEVLLALERIEHDEELSYEQLLVLETNLYLGSLSFHDRHRDMRMDIDNMSYEELLALEEKMGTVSTALSEEALSKCLRKSTFVPDIPVPGIAACGDDIKCSICQEEYVSGDEVGKLACEHRYHVDCIHQWLRLKNWCPICKSAAASSSSSSSSTTTATGSSEGAV